MRKIDNHELRDIQLNILQAVDHFCRKNNIRYSLACGTMLGAIRHGGYIPWDDDIDIYMPRADFERFEILFPYQYDKYYDLGSLKRDEEWCLPFGKVYDNRTIVYEKRSKAKTPGVCIDVFPIDEVSDDEEEFKKFNRKRKTYILNLRHSQMCFSDLNSFVKNCGVALYAIRFLFSSPRKLAEKGDRFAQIYNGKGNHRLFETSMGMTVKEPFEKELFDDITDISFENQLFLGFKNYDTYLTHTFGDYMKLPPMEKRVSEHTIDAYWKI